MSAPSTDTLNKWRATLASYGGAYAAAAFTLGITEAELRKWAPPAKPKQAYRPVRRFR
jgi:hypothetical protein